MMVHPNTVDLLLHPELGIVPAVIMMGLAVLLGVLLPALLLPGEHGPAVVPDRGGDAEAAKLRKRTAAGYEKTIRIPHVSAETQKEKL